MSLQVGSETDSHADRRGTRRWGRLSPSIDL